MRWLRLIEDKVHARPYSTSARRERSFKVVHQTFFEEAFEALPKAGVCATTTMNIVPINAEVWVYVDWLLYKCRRF
jgi:hypothetical protein